MEWSAYRARYLAVQEERTLKPDEEKLVLTGKQGKKMLACLILT